MHSCKFIFLITIFILGYSNISFAQKESKFEIKLLQEASNQPIQYANIFWQDLKDIRLKGNTISDSHGNIKIIKTNNDLVTLTVSCIGYKTFYDTILLSQTHEIYLHEDIFNLEQVTVTGTRTPYTLKKAPVLTQIISNKEIESTDAVTILNILEAEIPGIEMSQKGYGAAINMQGLDANYTLILMDGERMAGETEGNIDYSKINAGNIERIEIIRGASSTLYGSSAMGGVINIITKKPKNKIDLNVNLRYAELNQQNFTKLELEQEDDGDNRLYKRRHDLPNLNGNINFGVQNEKFYSNTFLNFKSADGYQLYDSKNTLKYYPVYDTTIIDNEHIGKDPTNINGFMDYTISQKIGYDSGKKWSHELRANYYKHEEFDFDNNSIHNLYRNFSVAGNTNYRLNSKQVLNLTLNHDTYNKYDVIDKSNIESQMYKQTFNNIKLSYTVKLGEKHNLLAGFENLSEELETDMFDSTQIMHSKNTNDIVLLLQDEFNLTKKIMIVAGVRNGWHSAYNYHITPSVTSKYTLNSFNFRLSYARGFRSPSLKELYTDWDHMGMFQIIGNPNLKPEQNNYYAFSTDYTNIKNSVNITLIASYNHIYNKIGGYWTDNQRKFFYDNLDELSVFNIEAILKWKFYKGFMLKSGYVYSKLEQIGEEYNLSAISPHAFTSQLSYSYTHNKYKLTVNISGKITGKKKYHELADENEYYPGEYYRIKLPTYSMWNVTINQNYLRYSLNVGVKNLFDYMAPIANFNTSTSPGRRFFIRLGYKF